MEYYDIKNTRRRRPQITQRVSGVFLLLCLISLSCGYRVGNAPAAVPGGVKSIAVPVFDNMTREPELGSVLAEALRMEILRRGIVKLMPVSQAEAVVRGTAEEVKMTSLSFDKKGFTTAYKVWLQASVRLERRGEILWRIEHTSRDEQIIVDNQPLDNAVRREYALNKIAADMMKQLHSLMLEGF